ncbi:replication initiation factor family protein [Photobacterium proteolyticum]|uniref:Replication initiation factor family protein n=2 Tax=Photobacterium proteolyticum TaxID=1903952 RepID=A0A1Q9G745_9GAMM|nr:replication initiation factor family protein [Photobacterium proteolyticum]
MAEQERPVLVDHLAFSFKFTELRHCHKADLSSFAWQKMPKATYQTVTNPQQRAIALERYQNAVREVLTDRLATFLFHVMGMTLSPMRGRGLHGYEDSAVILDKTGSVECGLMGVGGNNETVFIQLSGRGCKYLLEHTTTFRLHWWLTKILHVFTLSRLDLAVDDFSGCFDCKYAETAWREGAFRTSQRGMGPKVNPHVVYAANGDVLEEATIVGSRQSAVYWRVYNKKLEQGLNKLDITWYRNEVELKKCNVDALLDPAAAFAGICAFSASIEPTQGVSIKRVTKDACLDLLGRIRWTRRQCGKALSDVVRMFNGDTSKAFGLLSAPLDLDVFELEDYGKLALPETYQNIINIALEN